MMLTLKVNGEEHQLDVDPKMPLLWVLRDRLGLTGAKYGCGRAYCGACTVHIDGDATRACSIMAESAAGKSITTIEGVAGEIPHAVRKAWDALNVVQCGYCQPGQIMSAIVLLTANRNPTDAEIDASMAGNICRCGTYIRIRKAIHDAAKSLP